MDWLFDLGITVVIGALKSSVKNEKTKARIKAVMLKIRDMVNILYPDVQFTAARAERAKQTLEVA